jgi:hypothetical protein
VDAITPAHVATARTHLATALGQVTTGPQNERLKEIRNNLDYTEASVVSYPRHVPRPTTAAQAIALVDQVELTLAASIAAAASRPTLWTVLRDANRSIQAHTAPHENGQLWSGWNLHPAWEVARYVRSGAAGAASVVTRVNNLATSSNPQVVEYANTIQDLIAGRVVNKAANPLFASGLSGWYTWYTEPPIGAAAVTTSHIQSGRHTLKMSGGYVSGSIFQTDVPVSPGFFRASMWFYAPNGIDPRASIGLYAWCFNSAGTQLPNRYGELIRATKAKGAWTEVTWTDHIPAEVTKLTVLATLTEVSEDTEIFCGGAEFLQRDASGTYTYPADPVD